MTSISARGKAQGFQVPVPFDTFSDIIVINGGNDKWISELNRYTRISEI